MKKGIITFMCLVLMVNVASFDLFGREKGPRILIDPAKAIFGTPFSLKVMGLSPGEIVSLSASSTDIKGIKWESQAEFKADKNGLIDLANQAPLKGDYSEKDTLGLLWSMKPVHIKKEMPYFNDREKGLSIKFMMTNSRGETTTSELHRYYENPEKKLACIQLDENGLKGFLYSPDIDKKHPGIILLGGSNGGDFLKATKWMKEQKPVKKGKIGLIGGSRGGELVLLLGSMFDEFKVIIAWVPAAHLWQGMEFTKLVPCWTYKGKSLPFLGSVVSEEELKKFYTRQITSFRQYFEEDLKKLDPDLIKKAVIPVEKIKAPILMVSGTEDLTWPSAEFSEMIIKRLNKHDFKFDYKHIKGENAGHQVFIPDFIPDTFRAFNGGTRKAELHWSIKSWKQTLIFLHQYMDK